MLTAVGLPYAVRAQALASHTHEGCRTSTHIAFHARMLSMSIRLQI